jgi:hypothetical protein
MAQPVRHFQNDAPLTLLKPDVPWLVFDIASLDLSQFPTVSDFRLDLRDGPLGPHLFFTSDDLGTLAGFPWWDGVVTGLERMTVADIPLGTIQEPYCDLDQGWTILIFETSGYVYVRQGGEDRYTYRSWFRVTRTRYVREWVQAIAAYNPNFGKPSDTTGE